MKMTPALIAAACLVLAACDAPTDGTARSDTMPATSEGAQLFQTYCVACHGTDARGNGPLARASSKAPADLTLISLRHGDRFPTAKVLSIVDGYARSDLGGPVMPEFGELLQGDEVPYDSGDGVPTPTPRKLVAIVEYLKSIQTAR